MKVYKKERAKSLLNINCETKVILVAGNLNKYRGIKDAVKVRNELRKRFSKFNIELIKSSFGFIV